MSNSITARRHWRYRLMRILAVMAGGLLLTAAGCWLADRLYPLPLNEVQPAIVVVAQDGTPLWRFADRDGVWRYPVTLAEVSPNYIQALTGYEDRWFWYLPGINPLAILRAGWQNLRAGKIVSGGSTLTMQVARLIEPHSRSYTGKLRQIWRALQLEWHLSKPQILTLYLNRAPFGGTLQGVGAASWSYLGKSPAHLTDGEAALLAVLPQAPSYLRPDRWSQRAQAARDKVLKRLAKQGDWSASRVQNALEEAVWLAPRQQPHLAPLLSRYVVARQRQQEMELRQQEAEQQMATTAINKTAATSISATSITATTLTTANPPASPFPVTDAPAQRIVTTLDAGLQRQLENLALRTKNRLPPHASLAILVVEHSNMKVRGWAGSVDINDNSRQGHVDMVRAMRSPGSLLKPLLYGLALDDGLIHPASLLQDVPRLFDGYRPGNFDSDFHGAVSMSEALIKSLNLPAVQVLDAYGAKTFAARLRNTGIQLRFPPGAQPDLPMILGGVGIRLQDLVMVYSAFARQGQVAQLRMLASDPLRQRPLLSPGAAWIIRRILARQSRPLPDDQLTGSFPLAWKTGTSYGYRDAWAIGISPRYLIGIWTGRPDGSPVNGQFGFASAVPLLNQVNDLLQNKNRQRMDTAQQPRPPSVTAGEICWPGGQWLPAGDSNCRRRLSSWLLDHSQPPTLPSVQQGSSQPVKHTIWLNQNQQRVAPNCPDAQPHTLLLWPAALQPWLPASERDSARLPPASADCPPIPTAAPQPQLQISGIADNVILKRLTPRQQLTLPLTAQGGIDGQYWWFLNGTPLASHQQHIKLSLTTPARYQLVLLTSDGQILTRNFRLE